MKHISWVITLPLLAIAVVFAVNHRGRVVLDLWPLPLRVEPPLYLLVLLAIFVGFVIGGLVVWAAQGRNRHKARQRRFRVEELEREVTFLKRKLEKAEADRQAAEARAAQSGPGSAPPALPRARTGS
ncbi:LapA family protein [Ferruginivarius sediminum]|uniref:LapA family protein n=1 Tax=Ferruginivarius sediminum TaxID=2661937 RepID=UPI00137AD44C|nr:LapA family protein [Ferruginivarius sediminum]